MSRDSISIQVNGKPHQLDAPMTVAQLLDTMGLDNRHLAVECNLQLVPRSTHASRVLAEGDRLEIVTLVGGG